VVEFVLLFVAYLMILILGSYYVNLYISQEQFSKNELKAIVPYLSKLRNRVGSDYSILILGITFVVASLLGIALPMLSEHWLLNSSIFFVAMFYTFPMVKKNIEKARVTTGGNLYDTAMNIFVRYNNFILIGFGTGTGTALMYNWAVNKSVHFLWFLANFIVLSILIGIAIHNVTND
jgi:hypothetical protein